MEDKKQSVRIQTSILNPYEKKALCWMASRMPSWVTSDSLTYFGVFGAIVIAVGYALTAYSPAWLWLASFGFVLHWIGDSLDGTLARVRNQQRPLYGFYLDHNIDCVTEFFIFGGMGMSAYMNFWTGLLIFCVYLALEVYVMINAHLKNEFKLTYGKMGPTELRVIAVIVNTVIFFVTPLQTFQVEFDFLGRHNTLGIFDFIGLVIFVLLLVTYIGSLWKDGKYFAQIDPLKKTDE